MNAAYFVAIDFDGTIVDRDITDALIQKFARPGWEIPERLWEAGEIGSRECLEIQMSLISEPMDHLLRYIDLFSIDPHFIRFADFLNRAGVPYAIVSDGFRIFIERLLGNAGFIKMPQIYANGLMKGCFGLKPIFPHASLHCPSGTCKCTVADNLSGGLPVVLIGDGQSDFCLSHKAVYIFSKGKLGRFCAEQGLRFRPFRDFSDVEGWMKSGVEIVPVSGRAKFINYEVEEGQHICNRTL